MDLIKPCGACIWSQEHQCNMQDAQRSTETGTGDMLAMSRWRERQRMIYTGPPTSLREATIITPF